MEAEERRKKSIEILKKYNVPYFDKLPLIESTDTVKLRTREEIAKRMMILLIMANYACDVVDNRNLNESKEFFYEILKRLDLWNDMTKEEERFFISDIQDTKQAIQMTWSFEAVYTLAWVLGLIKDLPYPDKLCDSVMLTKMFVNVTSFKELLIKTKLRKVSEILDETDLIYRYHWATVDARIHNLPPPSKLSPDVIYERHKALNWVTKYFDQDWDDISTDT